MGCAKTIVPRFVEGSVDAPSSKSYAQRVVAARYLAGSGDLSAAQDCDDTTAALMVAEALASGEATVDVGESGLAARMFTPIAALESQPITITGRGSLLRRPMRMMTGPLRALGVEVTDSSGFLPLTVHGPLRGGQAEVDGSVSSQFLTGLLMALPVAENDTTLRVENLKSVPYIDMTLEVMRAFGVRVEHSDYREFFVPGRQKYAPTDFVVEGDWSAASCLLAAGACSGSVTVRNLKAASLQADVRILDALSAAGACVEQTADSVTTSRRSGLRAFSFDATDCPDLFPALVALAAAGEGVSTIVGTERLVHKESNRARALAEEFGKLGIAIDISEPNVMAVSGGSVRGGVEVSSHGDHRIAMALAVAALRADAPVTIAGAECVDKSYKNFWNDYERLRAARDRRLTQVML